jgi:cell division protein FtsB
MIKVCQFLWLSLLIYSCTIKDRQSAVTENVYAGGFKMISEGQQLLKDGDLVVRNNHDLTSQYIKQFNRHDKNYSHAGIVFYENGYPYVYHILPGPDNPGEKLRKDSLPYFSSPRKNFGYAIYRYKMDSSEIKQFKTLVTDWYKQGVVFDSALNLQTDKEMYCSEMIKKGLSLATNDRIVIETTKPTEKEILFFYSYLRFTLEYAKTVELVAIDNLFVNPHCQLVKRFDFPSQ